MITEVVEIEGVDFVRCPFCGEFPDIETDGSCIEINCCCSMSFQKSDYLTHEQRDTWSNTHFRYSVNAEKLVLEEAAKAWNRRA